LTVLPCQLYFILLFI